jgi:GR25 family glycosyltransferase involved in LPS biosynthesis
MYKILLLVIILIIILIILFYILNNNLKLNEKFTSYNKDGIIENTDIFVINLDKDKDRWDYYENLNIPSIKINRFDGIYGKDLDRNELIESGVLAEKNVLKDGQLGCALSHMNLWNYSFKYPNKYLLVLEDDAIIDKDIYKKINDLEDYLPEVWDVIFLGGCNVYGKKYNQKFIIPTKYNKLYNLCLHAMLINKKSIPKLNKIMKPLMVPIDNQIRNNYKDLNVFYANPNLINQNKDLISSRRVIDGLPQSEFWKKNHLNMYIE